MNGTDGQTSMPRSWRAPASAARGTDTRLLTVAEQAAHGARSENAEFAA
jgi:hypothetical protein